MTTAPARQSVSDGGVPTHNLAESTDSVEKTEASVKDEPKAEVKAEEPTKESSSAEATDDKEVKE